MERKEGKEIAITVWPVWPPLNLQRYLSLSPPPLSFPYDSCRQFQGPVNSPPLILPYLSSSSFFSRSAQRPGHLLAAVPVDAGRGHVQGEVARLRDVSDAKKKPSLLNLDIKGETAGS